MSVSSSERKAPHALHHWHADLRSPRPPPVSHWLRACAFRTAAEAAPREVRTYCWTLLYTGCRPSEALALTADRVDFRAAVLTFASKKKRRPGLYRAVPVPATLLDALDLVHGLRDRAPAQGGKLVFPPVTHARSGERGRAGKVSGSGGRGRGGEG